MTHSSLIKCVVTIVLLFICSACGITIPSTYDKGRLVFVQQGMTKQQVEGIFTYPDAVTIEPHHAQKQTMSVWQYDLYPKGTSSTNLVVGICLSGTLSWWIPNMWNSSEPYYFVFVDDSLSMWGRNKKEIVNKVLTNDKK